MVGNYSYVIAKGRISEEKKIKSTNLIDTGIGLSDECGKTELITIEAIEEVLYKLYLVIPRKLNRKADKLWRKNIIVKLPSKEIRRL